MECNLTRPEISDFVTYALVHTFLRLYWARLGTPAEDATRDELLRDFALARLLEGIQDLSQQWRIGDEESLETIIELLPKLFQVAKAIPPSFREESLQFMQETMKLAATHARRVMNEVQSGVPVADSHKFTDDR